MALLALCWSLPFALLALAEGALRIAGYGENLAPVLFESHQGTGYWVWNERFLRQFVNIAWEGEELDAPVIKPPNTKRIAVFGESAAHGYPTREFAFPRCLEALLRARYPGTDFDFFNMAYPGVDSHILYAEARAAVKTFQPDAILVYMGNNETIGPFGPKPGKNGTVSVPGIWWARMTMALNQCRLMQLCRAWLAPKERDHSSTEAFGPKHPKVARIYANFAANLRGICRTAEHAGIPVVLCTVATALGGCAPDEAPDRAQRPPEWTALLDEGIARQGAGDCDAALLRFEQALERYPDDAELHFRIGQCRWALGDFALAKEAFHAAREYDGFRFARARDPINAAIRDEAAARDARGVHFADVEAGIAAASENGIPSLGCFLDQCHFSFRGATVAAQTILPVLTEALALPTAAPTMEDTETAMHYCAKALAFSRDSFKKEVEYRKIVAECYNRFNRDEIIAWGNAHETEANTFPGETAVALYRNALALLPNDFLLSWEMQEALKWAGRLDEALEMARATVKRYPCRNEGKLELAHILTWFAKAPPPGCDASVIARHAREALALYAQLEGSGIALETLLSLKVDALCALEQYPAVLSAVTELLTENPDNVMAWCLKGDAFVHLGQNEAARAAYLEAIERDPCNVAAFRAYQTLLAGEADTESQLSAWRELIRQHPESPFPRACLGDTCFAVNRYMDALAAYREAAAVTDSPCDLQYFKENVDNMLIECGHRLLKEERHEEAKALFEEVLAKRTDISAILGLSAIYRKENLPDLEEALLKNAIVQLPEETKLFALYDDFLCAHYSETGRSGAWAALKQAHPEILSIPAPNPGTGSRHESFPLD